ncbi:unnamed protein product [Acanthosepion pharaonis]|uniref:Uncharacterized protein n=1 Tax=Acanthosepion pharaonis TaxID=158019 RepID=A0A812C3E0_ACAPH|nr:unnamed protein product [Sepia pharaonis]
MVDPKDLASIVLSLSLSLSLSLFFFFFTLPLSVSWYLSIFFGPFHIRISIVTAVMSADAVLSRRPTPTPLHLFYLIRSLSPSGYSVSLNFLQWSLQLIQTLSFFLSLSLSLSLPPTEYRMLSSFLIVLLYKIKCQYNFVTMVSSIYTDTLFLSVSPRQDIGYSHSVCVCVSLSLSLSLSLSALSLLSLSLVNPYCLVTAVALVDNLVSLSLSLSLAPFIPSLSSANTLI